MSSFIGFGGIGLLDDICKISQPSHRGISARYKYSLQSIVALIIAATLYKLYPELSRYTIGSTSIQLGWGFIPWAYWIIISSTNAFNLTDGLDGLASSQVVIIATGLLVLSFYNYQTFSSSVQPVIVLYGPLIGSALGFLWYNQYPAKIFMGDTGALALGAVLAVRALVLHQEIVFCIMAIVPVLETISVILQVAFFKWTRKRLFRMAPFHHHLELLGYSEVSIVMQLSILTSVVVCFTWLLFTFFQ